nr:tRNA (N(6)-L-threonylcarbamoyladenosine(37)-C(2))-methylthiotransferase MtaB [Nitrospirota bacterium]
MHRDSQTQPVREPRQAGPRASLHTIGCRLNQAETALLADRLKRDGYRLVEHGEPTDLFVLNSCSVTEDAEKDCRYQIRRTLRHSPHAFVAVTGCYAQTGVEGLRRFPGIDLIVGGRYKMELPDYLPVPSGLAKQPAPRVLHTRTIERADFVLDGTGDCDSTRANLKIQDGCDFMCSFCNIPFARGHERSRQLPDVLREAEALVARGHRELILTGVNIGQYRHDGRSLLDLIKELEQVSGVERIRISSIEPTTIPDALLDHMAASSKLCHYLHIPLQSGDDGILRAMNRRYRAGDYAFFLKKAAGLIPDLCLGTDLMVGFPGEDDQSFANTYKLVADLPLAYFHIFNFSARPGTAAAKLPDAIQPATLSARAKALASLSRAKRLTFYQRFTGRTLPVLFEAREPSGLWTGWTGNYLRVGVRSDRALRKHIEPVVVTGAMDGLAVGHLGGTGGSA